MLKTVQCIGCKVMDVRGVIETIESIASAEINNSIKTKTKSVLIKPFITQNGNLKDKK